MWWNTALLVWYLSSVLSCQSYGCDELQEGIHLSHMQSFKQHALGDFSSSSWKSLLWNIVRPREQHKGPGQCKWEAVPPRDPSPEVSSKTNQRWNFQKKREMWRNTHFREASLKMSNSAPMLGHCVPVTDIANFLCDSVSPFENHRNRCCGKHKMNKTLKNGSIL